MDVLRKISSAIHLRSKGGHHDDWVDRMNWKVTGAILLGFTVLVTTHAYVGEPIRCWCPKEYPSKWVKFTNTLCWLKNTYYIEIDEPIPQDENLKPQLRYYQWMPFILLFMAWMFYLPSILWASVTNHMGISVQDITEAGKKYSEATKPADRQDKVKHIAATINYLMGIRKRRHRSKVELKLKIFCSKRRGNFLVFCYLLIKILYLINIIGQFYLLNVFLDTSFSTFGVDVTSKLIDGQEFKESPYFPRVTLCDIAIRGMGNLLRPYTVECVMTINLFNEKIFIFLWFWFCFVAIMTAISFIRWLLVIAVPQLRAFYIKRYLSTALGKGFFDQSEKNRRKLDEFVDNFLRDDGAFIIRMLHSNASDLVTTEVLRELWETFDVVRDTEDTAETPL